MTDLIERQARAEEAARLLRDPLLKEAFDTFELALMNRALEAPVRDDEARRRCLDAVTTLRKVRGQLEAVIKGGQAAAHNAAMEIAPYLPPEKRRWIF